MSSLSGLTILISGSSGLIGTSLSSYLVSHGCRIIRLVRNRCHNSAHCAFWDPDAGLIELDRLTGIDAAVNLAGENIAAGRWTAERKHRILSSRIKSTDLLCRSMASLGSPPKVIISASAVGYYGDRGDAIMTEQCQPGDTFLSTVVREWETATAPAEARNIRVVHLRFGAVLSRFGGALQKMLLPFKLGLGGKLGSGRQYMSWIALGDVCRIIEHCIVTSELSGAFNAVSPNPVTNVEFTRTLAQTLHRPALFGVPAAVLRLLLGEMAQELLLASTRALPDRLERSGFKFASPELREVLLRELGSGAN